MTNLLNKLTLSVSKDLRSPFEIFRRYRLQAFHFTILVLAFTLISATATRSEVPQLWDFTHFRLYDEGKTRIDLTLHGRLVEDVSKLSVLQIQPKLSRQVTDGLRLGLNYSYFSIRQTNDASGEDQFINQNRAELEVLPEVRLNDLLNLVQRTRYEYLMDNDFEKLNTRLRHRMQFITEPLNDQGLRLVTGTELFYDIGSRSFNQARTVQL